jgi:hypothetical protein
MREGRGPWLGAAAEELLAVEWVRRVLVDGYLPEALSHTSLQHHHC